MLFTQGKKLPEVLQNSTCSLDTDTHIHKGLEKCLFRNSPPHPLFCGVVFLNSNKKENTSFSLCGFWCFVVVDFSSFFFTFFFMQKELGESMRMFEGPELEGSGK